MTDDENVCLLNICLLGECDGIPLHCGWCSKHCDGSENHDWNGEK